MPDLTFYIAATSPRPGALAVVHVYGGEEALVRGLDGRIGGRRANPQENMLSVKELRYGWLWSSAGEVVDEVMIAKPNAGMRVLMTHGGSAVREAVASHLESMGFLPFQAGEVEAGGLEMVDSLYHPLLAGCVTEAQAAAVLAALQAGEEGRPVRLPEKLLQTHRILVCGPPNAGKSSLLNALAGYDRAFVNAEAGATRDVVDELVDVGGYAVLLGDLPGFAGREEGLAGEAWKKASLRLRLTGTLWFVVDASRPWEDGGAVAAGEIARLMKEMDGDAPEVAVICNKSDLPTKLTGEPWREYFPHAHVVSVCSLCGGDAREKLGAMLVRAWAEDSIED